jgi:hypothetical protein
MSRIEPQGAVEVLLSGPAERFVVDVFALLLRSFPHLDGRAVEGALGKLSDRLPVSVAAGVLNGFIDLLVKMHAAGRLPRVRGCVKPAGKTEILLVCLLSAAQRGDRGRTIEAAIALLDSGRVPGVVVSAERLALQLRDNGIIVPAIGQTMFNYVAGYPWVKDPFRRDKDPQPAAERPVLRLLQSA